MRGEITNHGWEALSYELALQLAACEVQVDMAGGQDLVGDVGTRLERERLGLDKCIIAVEEEGGDLLPRSCEQDGMDWTKESNRTRTFPGLRPMLTDEMLFGDFESTGGNVVYKSPREDWS